MHRRLSRRNFSKPRCIDVPQCGKTIIKSVNRPINIFFFNPKHVNERMIKFMQEGGREACFYFFFSLNLAVIRYTNPTIILRRFLLKNER